MIDHPLTYWLIFSHSHIANKTSITEILNHYSNPEHFVKDKIESFKDLKAIDWHEIERACEWAEHHDQHIIPFSDPKYPALLKEIPHPPPILYIKGKTDLLNSQQIAVVGSRYPSHSGKSITHHITHELVNAGLCITSGLAMGIDAASHEAALQSGGQTIAVLGNGLNSIYPKQNSSLANSITEQGCLISEFTLDAPPNKKHFPQRNRIISGLSLGTLVVEAKLRSGSLITARYAAEQGRDVFAIPGSIRHALSHGCHQLLRDGAVLTESVQDILDTLNIHQAAQHNNQNISKHNNLSRRLDPKQQQLLACVDHEETSIEEIINRSQLTVSEVNRLLLNLELDGYISSTLRGYIRITS